MLPGRSRSHLDVVCVPERQHGACGVQDCFEAVWCGGDLEDLPDVLAVTPGYYCGQLTALRNVPHVAYRSGVVVWCAWTNLAELLGSRDNLHQ